MIATLTHAALPTLGLGLGAGLGLLLGLTARARTRERTLRGRTEQVRRVEEERFQAIFESANDMIVVHQARPGGRRFVEVNGRACELLGYTRAELLELGPRDLLPPEYAALVEARIEEVRTRGRHVFEVRLLTRAGGTMPVEVSSRWFLLDGVPSVASSCRDLTLRKRAEERLRVIERRFRNIMECTSDGVALLEADFRPIDANRRFLEIFGCAPAQAGEVAARLLPEPEREPTAAVPSAPRAWESELDADGKRLFLELNAVPAPEGRLLLVVRDVTEKRRLREETLRAAQLASLGELAAGVAHEINNPLNVILSYAELLEDGASSPPGGPSFPAEIRTQARRISGIVSSLLSLAKVQPEERVAVAPGAPLEEALRLVRRRMEREGVRFEVGEPPVGARVLVRPGELQRVYINLLDNARLAMNERFPEPHADKVLRVHFSRCADGDAPLLRTSLRDSGPGFGPEALERACEPFYTTRPRNLGTGLGLALSYRILRELGGRLVLENAPEGGAVAHVDLPLAGGPA